MKKCNEPLFVNDYQTFYCGLEEAHKGQHVAMIPFGEDKK